MALYNERGGLIRLTLQHRQRLWHALVYAPDGEEDSRGQVADELRIMAADNLPSLQGHGSPEDVQEAFRALRYIRDSLEELQQAPYARSGSTFDVVFGEEE